jgi:acetylxylan esterase
MGSGPGYSRETKFMPHADQKGFIMIYPSGANMTDGKCWDVGTKASLTNGPGAGGDTLSIVSMVKYTIEKYNADPKKVFVTGSSSGAMMTMTICAVYPDVFAGGAAYSGIPSGCLAGSPGFGPFTATPTCANGKMIKTPQAWGAQARTYAPSYKGEYPRMQIWHGTSDFVVNHNNLAEGLKQWSNLHGIAFSKNNTNTPKARYTQIVYGDGTKLVGYSGQGVGHVVPTNEQETIKFFGL